ncbi:beta-amylase 8-like isoform X2 [Cucurbita pepo subsp. pepo]|uniref:beta-amylase 8-like isoform X2 n=1 Tax=Cucurbita pepo subsp. pepo TaxID=3664 RepID=UPI000C9D4F60|nr:beta-amylase 8-like isoform X2 [Cucurbita pepo subsp. pepo]
MSGSLNDDSFHQDLQPRANNVSDYLSHQLQPPQPPPRRPRGFAATAAAIGQTTSTASATGGKAKREREKEKERTKLRERHRRAITSRILAGLRQYGNFPLPARADMNDVLAALAREAGWVVEVDGTTYRHSTPPSQSQEAAFPVRSASLDSVVITERDAKNEKYAALSPLNSAHCLEDQLIQDIRPRENESQFGGTPYVPVYVTLSTGFINNFCLLIDPDGVRQELSHLKALNVDGVIVDCWWGIIEAWNPQKYVWSGYRDLFNIIREFKLKLQVVMAFHACEGTESGDAFINLPQWVLEIGKENPDIFFTDREGRRNEDCLSWGIDKERVLRGRTGMEVYFDFMRSFHTEFNDLFAEGFVSAIEVGLGASGELKYPSFSKRMGWSYPGIGEFQCYDKYLQQSLRKAAGLRGHSFWARGPDNSGQYNSRPHESGFFCERGDYDSYYGRFFLQWYAQMLIYHVDNVLSLASLVFEETKFIVKIPAVYWWYKTSSHAAELTAGFYNPSNQDGYSPVLDVLKKHSVIVKLVCSGMPVTGQEVDDALADPESLSWQILNSAWDRGLAVAGENSLSCYDREGHMRIIDMAKPRNDPDRHHFSFFAYRQQPAALIQGAVCFPELDYFIKCMHGEIVDDLVPC